MTLEELLKAACDKGMTHFTLYPVHSEDRKTVYWCARSSPSTGHQYISASDIDPVKVMTTVLENLPKAKKRVPKEPGMTNGTRELEGITATVKDTPLDEIDQWLPKT